MIELNCSACGRESLLKREPRYEGFKKVGEILSCSACGHVFASEAEVPFKQKRQIRVFDESDAPRKVKVFKEAEAGNLCHHCHHYVVNPFIQRCGKHGKIVEATDTCSSFEARK